MSSIGWYTRDEGKMYVQGSERAHMGNVVANLATSLLPWETNTHRHRLVQPLNRDQLAITMRVGAADRGSIYDEGGQPLNDFHMLINTVLVIGNDVLCMMARIHGQCEIHLYVEGPNRVWLAGLIEQGMESRLLREREGWDMGWPDLVGLLRARDDAPVVTDYSVEDGFPQGLLETDEWGGGEYLLPRVEQWDLGLARLRERNAAGSLVELSPANLREPLGHGRNLVGFFG